MKTCTLFVRSLGCDSVATFRVRLNLNLNPEALEDRLSKMGCENFEIARIIGSQGAVFYDFKVPHDRLFDSRKEGLLGALAQVEREVQAAVEQKRLLGMVEQS